uniref:Uncharacterized protein n=1 Tax=Medicago truncatula TaxID=3880 RepID=A2Q473_MEDTR|nr:hypothetical protein MtrDRAFT_AC157373g18v2 [Medicago truncatula]
MDYFHDLFLYLSFWKFASFVKFQIDHVWDKKKLAKEINESSPKETKMSNGKRMYVGEGTSPSKHKDIKIKRKIFMYHSYLQCLDVVPYFP